MTVVASVWLVDKIVSIPPSATSHTLQSMKRGVFVGPEVSKVGTNRGSAGRAGSPVKSVTRPSCRYAVLHYLRY